VDVGPSVHCGQLQRTGYKGSGMILITVWMCHVIQRALQAIRVDRLHRVSDEFDYCVYVSCDPACTDGYYSGHATPGLV
jgi:hypothetical protein